MTDEKTCNLFAHFLASKNQTALKNPIVIWQQQTHTELTEVEINCLNMQKVITQFVWEKVI